MANNLLSDPALDAAHAALDGLSKRLEVISNNLANADTPGYHAETVDFEGMVQAALRQGSELPMATTSAAHLASPAAGQTQPAVVERQGGVMRADQNNVDVAGEMVDLNATSLRYQALTQMISKKFVLLKDILSSR